MNENELLIAENLDIEFEYPDEYKKFLPQQSKLDQTSWWLIGKTSGAFHTCYDVINFDYKSSKLLVPFAKSDQSNILACFDETYRVWLTSCENNDITDADWDNRFSMPNFTAWLDKVLSYEIV